MKYRLGDYTVKNWNDWDRVPRDPISIGTAIAASIGVTSAIGVAVTIGVTAIAISTVTSWAVSALSPKPDFSAFAAGGGSAGGSAGVLVNSKEAAAPVDFVYGEVRKGGVVSFYETTGAENKFLHQVIVLAGHEVAEIGDIYVNDDVFNVASDTIRYEVEFYVPDSYAYKKIIRTLVVPDNPSFRYDVGQELTEAENQELLDNAISYSDEKTLYKGDEFPPTIRTKNSGTGGKIESSPWNGKIRINKHNGDQVEADNDLLQETSVGRKFIGKGVAYLYVRYEYDQDVFANGLPLITAMVKGKKVYDPRTSLTAYSDNAALCIRDYITSAYGLSDNAIDDVTFAAAANECDELIPLSGGGTEKRYTINGIATSATPIKTVLGDMSTACAGTIFWGSGYWKLKVGAYSTPVKTLTLDDLRGSISLDTRTTMRDNFNTIRGTFNDASQDYITADYPEITSTAFKAEDNGEEVALDLPLPYTTSASTAQRLAKLTLYRGREQMTLSAEFGLEALSIEVGDIIGFTNERYGFDEKEFEVVGWRFTPDAEAGDLRVNLTLRETSEEAFYWDAEETEIIKNNSTLPSFTFVPTVGLNVAGTELRLANQQVLGVILIDVTLNPLRANRLEMQFRKHGAVDWVSVGETSSVSSSNRFEISGESDGYFDFRSRAINSMGFRGEWSTVDNIYVSIFAEPPEDVQNLSANVVGNTLHLSWTPVGDLDLSHYKLRYSPLISGAEYHKSIDLVKRISRPANTAIVPAQTGTYFLKALDKLGNVSQNPAAIVIDTNVADIDYLNVIVTQNESPSFSGAKSDVVLLSDEDGNYITLNTAEDFDDMAGDFDDQVGLFDGGGADASIAGEGTYDFDGYIDLGNIYVSRVVTSMELNFLDYANSFDSAAELFDSREGFFDGDATSFDTTSVRAQVSFTNDDPSGSPAWSAYRDFIVGDVRARALRFRAVLESSDGNNAPLVRELSVSVDMPDRVDAGDDLTFTGTTTVLFSSPFQATPAIGVSASLSDGDRYAITSKTRSGFTITNYTGASVSTNPLTFDYVAKGYGKELT